MWLIQSVIFASVISVSPLSFNRDKKIWIYRTSVDKKSFKSSKKKEFTIIIGWSYMNEIAFEIKSLKENKQFDKEK